MALRSVVVEPAPPSAPRRTVVLRAGGPAPRGGLLDVLVGILGAILLISAIALANVLPDKTYLNPQFRLSFLDQGGEFGTQETPAPLLDAGQKTHEFTFQIDEGNVQSITINVGFEDDRPFSKPDTFRIELIDPAGNLVQTHKDLSNPPPKPVPANGTSPPTFEPQPIYQPFTFEVVPHPVEQVVPGLFHDETVEQVLAREEPKYRVSNAGVWTVRVTLIQAGDCPDPQTDADNYDPQLAFYCVGGDPNRPDSILAAANAAQGGQDPAADPGNLFSVQTLRYTWYTPVIEELN